MCACLHTGDYAGAFRVLLYDGSEEAALCRRMLGQYLLYAAVVAEENRLFPARCRHGDGDRL